MLDLEGVLIATAIPGRKHNYGVRPHAQEFIDEVVPLFDQTYLNTCVGKEKALQIMDEAFSAPQIMYYEWDKYSRFGKASGYENLIGYRLIHVEDESPRTKEAQSKSPRLRLLIIRFDIIVVNISWHFSDLQ